MNIDFQCVEEFFKAYQYTFQALGVIATVIVAWLALNQNKSKLSARFELVGFSIEVIGISYSNKEWISISVTNKGLLPIFINPYLRLKIPFIKPTYFNINDSDEQHRFKIEPRNTKSFSIENIENFSTPLKELKSKHFLLYSLFLSAELRTTDDRAFKLKNIREIKEKIAQDKPS